ncbi:2-dehydro-3-deoxygluconokinase [Lactococcus hodotermopsidis]|uniref:2-dehydro-3-deoxygluconokinase n=1 Tax=Pseudolactococcus hodotermopsidis TaxID=2709157 RepID=A0A6A0B9A3_9LACT|nr:sugar kinase [Lactococcus hodotermopsidis]GFH41942.1 2-dehydro-3-deoxygluconokinase [Lactococcus hodotermopsidis]
MKIVTLGEIMARFSTTAGNRLAQAEHFQVVYGGGEANVAISLANFGHEVAFASKVPENPLGEAVKRHLNSYGVSTEFLLKGGSRLGTYYMEAGVGERGAAVFFDRAGSSFAEMLEIEWELAEMFKGVDLFHISGIAPAVSLKWRELTLELVKAAKSAGCQISFDVNYRGKMWTQAECGAVIQTILPYVDYCSAGHMDALYLLGIPKAPEEISDKLVYYYEKMSALFPNIKLFYATKREVISSSHNKLTGHIWSKTDGIFTSKTHDITPIVDRVGGGDAFSGGVLHGLLSDWSLQKTIDFGTAASSLKHTIHGDTNQFSEKEVLDFARSGSGAIQR